jgi:hypothetical protein
MQDAQAPAELTGALERSGRECAARWQQPPPGVKRLDLVRALALGAGWEVYFDAHGQAVLHTGLYLQHDGEIARIAAPCVERP